MIGSKKGFTVVELVVIIAVIGILVAITTIGLTVFRNNASDAQKQSKATTVAQALEKYYAQKGEYPSVAAVVSNYDPDTNTETNSAQNVAAKLGIDQKSLRLPTTPAGQTNALVGTGDVSGDVILYKGYVDTTVTQSTAANCSDNPLGGCDGYTLEYKRDSDGGIQQSRSNKWDRSLLEVSPTTGSGITITEASNKVQGVIGSGSVSCTTPATPQFALQYTINNTRVSGWSDWSSSPIRATTENAGQGNKYYFEGKVRCYNPVTAVGSTPTDLNATYVKTILKPSVVSVAVNPSGDGNSNTVTWSWNNFDCADESDVEFRYYKLHTNGNDASPTTLTGLSFTRTDANIINSYYGINVQAQCKTAFATSGWTINSNNPQYHRVILPPNAPSSNIDGTGASPSVVSCPQGDPQYSMQWNYDNGAWSGWSAWASSARVTSTFQSGHNYGYQSKARCVYNSAPSSEAVGSANFNDIGIPAPASPNVWISDPANTPSGDWTQIRFNWSANTNCSATGLSTGYSIQAFNNYPYDGGWTETGDTTAIIGTEQGLRLSLRVVQRCYNSTTNKSSGWSGAGTSGNYLRNVVHFQVSKAWLGNTNNNTPGFNIVANNNAAGGNACADGLSPELDIAKQRDDNPNPPHTGWMSYWRNDWYYDSPLGDSSSKGEFTVYSRCRRVQTDSFTSTDQSNIYQKKNQYNWGQIKLLPNLEGAMYNAGNSNPVSGGYSPWINQCPYGGEYWCDDTWDRDDYVKKKQPNGQYKGTYNNVYGGPNFNEWGMIRRQGQGDWTGGNF